MKEADTWSKRLEGEPKTWERFCAEILGYDAGYIQKIAEGVAVLEGQGVKDATVKQALDAVKVRAASFDGSELSQPEIGKGKAGPGRGD